MVCRLTLGKPRFAAIEGEITEVLARLERCRGMLEQLIDEDAAAYGELSAAFKLPKSDAARAPQ